MICNTKTEFLTGLRIALENNNVTDTRDILTDFRQHFEDGEAAGESEADVCRKLGDIDEIIKQYITEDAEQKASTPDASGFGANAGTGAPEANTGAQVNTAPQTPNYYTAAQNTASQAPSSGSKAGKIVGLVCLDVFVFSWAVPSLLSVILGLIGTTIGFVVSGIAVFIVGMLSFFIDLSGFVVTGFVPLSLIFLGIMMSALGGMLVIASIAAVKGFINVIISIINLHARWLSGHNILEKIGKREDD